MSSQCGMPFPCRIAAIFTILSFSIVATAQSAAPMSAQSDFIISAFGEELGLNGLMAILIIFGLIVERGLRAAVGVRDPFAKLLAGGLSFVLALQVFVIVGGVTRVIPLTGVTLPFISYGGASIVANFVLLALLLLVSDRSRRPVP